MPAPTAGGSPLSSRTQYDAVGNRTAAIDPNGQVTAYAYDERDSLQEVRESPSPWTDVAAPPAGLIRTGYEYDHLGNLTRVLRAKGDGAAERATDYAYDGAGRLRRESQYPSWPQTTPTLVTRHEYDPSGNRVRTIDPKGQATTVAYDALNRLTSISYAAGTPDVSYAYDPHGNRTSMQDGTGQTSYAHDELDRLISVTSPGPKTVGYRYDRGGNRTKLLYPDGTAVTSAFDKADRLASLADWASRTTRYDYFADGGLEGVTHANGTTTRYQRDQVLRLREITHQQGATAIGRHTYTLDAAGNRTGLDELAPRVGAPPAAEATTYGYDRLYRLTSVAGPSGTTSYAYDPVGNRTSRVQGGTTETYAYDKADRVTQVGATAYTVDPNGNLTARGADTFGYDQRNLLTSATVGTTSATYAYDGAGKRASTTVGPTTTRYTSDVNRSLPVLLDDGARKYVWGQGLAYAVDGANMVQVYHADGLGSVRAIADATGAVVQTAQTDEFRAPTQTQGAKTELL